MGIGLAGRAALRVPPVSPDRIREADIYAGFGWLSRFALIQWKRQVIRVALSGETPGALARLDAALLEGNAVVFIDHHYAFDALPIALGLGKALRNVTGVMIPYAAHLDMRLDPQGWPSWRYSLRTRAWRWLVAGIQRGAPAVTFLPIAREFELNNPRLKAVVDERFDNSNTRYLKALLQMFTSHRTGQMWFLAPMAGLALPARAVLNPQLYRSLDLVRSRAQARLPFYFVGAYPRWDVHRNYFAPLLAPHAIVARGPFEMPTGDYGTATSAVSEQLSALRMQADFTAPDYSRIKHK